MRGLGLITIILIGFSSWAQYYDSTEIYNINTARTAAEGDLYQDTVKGNYFIGLTSGALTQINFNPDTTSLSNRINNNLDSINLNEQAIIDTASTIRTTLNEKVNISDTAAMLAPYLLEADQLDTTSLSNRINANLDSINLNEQAIIDTAINIRGYLSDTALLIRSLIENHILADLDTDSTNEYNTGFAMNGTGDSLIITDVGTRYAVAVDNI